MNWSAPTNAQSGWQLASRLQTGMEYDNNIYESTSRATATSLGRVLMQTRATNTSGRWRVALEYTGAFLLYHDHHDENKVLQEAAGSVTWAGKALKLYGRGQGHLKLYLENPADYGTTSGTLGAIFPLGKRLALEAGLETGQLDYAGSDDFDFTFNGAFAALRPQLGAHLTGEAALTFRKLNYVSAFFLNTPTSLETELQTDDFAALRFAASYSRTMLLQGRLELQRNRSNRRALEYNRVQIHLLAGYPFAPRWLFRTSLLWQNKSYLEVAPPLSLPELDPEREQSNHLILDLSHDLSRTTTLLLRFSQHNNESPVRSLFYRKTMLFTGFEMRF